MILECDWLRKEQNNYRNTKAFLQCELQRKRNHEGKNSCKLNQISVSVMQTRLKKISGLLKCGVVGA